MTGASMPFPNRISAVSTTADLRVTAASIEPPISGGAAVTSHSVVAASLRGAPAREGSSLDLPAVSSGIAGLSARSIKKAITFAVAAASEIICKSSSLVKA